MASPKPRIRMQMEEPTAAVPQRRAQPAERPSPAQLGVATKKEAADVNWDDVGKRLQRLKITSFHLQKLSNGQGFRFICVLPGAPGRQVRAEAVTESEAIDQALAQAEIMQ